MSNSDPCCLSDRDITSEPADRQRSESDRLSTSQDDGLAALQSDNTDMEKDSYQSQGAKRLSSQQVAPNDGDSISSGLSDRFMEGVQSVAAHSETTLEPGAKRRKLEDCEDTSGPDTGFTEKKYSGLESRLSVENPPNDAMTSDCARCPSAELSAFEHPADTSVTAVSGEIPTSEFHDPTQPQAFFNPQDVTAEEGYFYHPSETMQETYQEQEEWYMPVAEECLDFTIEPRLLGKTVNEYNNIPENFLRGCIWSPDGSCLLTNSQDNLLRFYYFEEPEKFAKSTSASDLNPMMKIKENELIYDYCWNPYIRVSANQEDCFVLTTCRDMPIHLWNICDGQLRASYKAYNDVDEVTAAYCLTVSADGGQIYSGFNKAIRIFDTSRPGRVCDKRITYGPLTETKWGRPIKGKKKKGGQPGIVSCIALHPLGESFFAAGAFSSSIALYPRNVREPCLARLQGQKGGVTHLRFSPDGTKLYSGGRKDNEIICWDVRQLNNIYCAFSAKRLVNTNQRIYFDLDSTGQFLVSGSCDGRVSVWDTTLPAEMTQEGPVLDPVASFRLHDDAVNGVSLHPSLPLLATASGQRHFPVLHAYSDSDSDASSDSVSSEEREATDFSVRLWKLHTQALHSAALAPGGQEEPMPDSGRQSGEPSAGEDSTQSRAGEDSVHTDTPMLSP